MSHYANVRKERIQTLKKFVKSEGEVLQDKVEGEMSIEYGVTDSKTEEYLQTLKKAELIRFEENGEDKTVIKWVGKE